MSAISVSQNTNVNTEPGKLLLRRPRVPKPLEPIKVAPVRRDIYSIHTGSMDGADIEEFSLNDRMSPPPPRVQPLPDDTLAQRLSIKKLRVARWERRYMIDPGIESRISSQKTDQFDKRDYSLLRPRCSRGPQGMPNREPAKRGTGLAPLTEFIQDTHGNDDDIRYLRPPLFTLNNFLLRVSESEGVPLERVKRAMFSTHNYKKIQDMVARQIQPLVPTLTHIDLDEEVKDSIPEVQNRLPSHHVLLEMTALIKEHLARSVMTQVECKVHRLPKFDPRYAVGEAPHTEIVVFEKETQSEMHRYLQFDHSYEHPDQEGIFSAGDSRTFQGGKRSGEPFAADDQISPGEVCVLDSIMNGGIALSIKANFMQRLPDLGSLNQTLTYINLSYNSFMVVPVEIFSIRQLEVLKMRNNPLREIPAHINTLETLTTLILSFCLIDEIPASLYSLKKLKTLDLSYNSIPTISNEVRQLSQLKNLNLEGNELSWMPWGLLRLNIGRLRIRNNFLHPLLWKETGRNPVQKLADISALAVQRLATNLATVGHALVLPAPEKIRSLYRVSGKCDGCQGPVFGRGLRTIRPCKRLFGVRMVPMLFLACSPTCQAAFLDKDSQLVDMLYRGEVDLDPAPQE